MIADSPNPTKTKTPQPVSLSEMGCQELYRRLFDEFYRPAFYFFSRRGFSIEECQDLAQETFLRVYSGLDGYRSEAGYRTWILAIARNLWLNHRRNEHASKRAHLKVSFDEAFDGLSIPDRLQDLGGSADLDPEEELLDGERRKRLRSAVLRLPPQARRCQMLRLQGLKYREIGTILGISLQAVRSHLFQARERLEIILSESIPEDVELVEDRDHGR
jgi:RNA polymerase sigma-70 factor (ECF subfamily)